MTNLRALFLKMFYRKFIFLHIPSGMYVCRKFNLVNISGIPRIEYCLGDANNPELAIFYSLFGSRYFILSPLKHLIELELIWEDRQYQSITYTARRLFDITEFEPMRYDND